MVEKRFEYNVNKNSIEYDGKHFTYCNVEQSKIAKKLNELHEENKELKQFKKSVFALINEKITFVNECEKNHNDIGIPHEYYRGADEILNLLKKELVE